MMIDANLIEGFKIGVACGVLIGLLLGVALGLVYMRSRT